MHGWLTEVMEAPTPVSALLHAGVINAGGFLLIRFADVMLLAPSVLAGLVLIGGFTALFAGLVMLTQPAVKTSLAWSTVAQMGFMILECGLALFPLALLHIVAHSLYKAHSFLASGGAVELIAANRRPGPVAIPKAGAVGRAFLLALVIYAVVGFGFAFQHKSPQAIALGAILIFGVAYMLAQGFGGRRAARIDRAYRRLRRRHVSQLFRTPGVRDLADFRGCCRLHRHQAHWNGRYRPCGRQFRPCGGCPRRCFRCGPTTPRPLGCACISPTASTPTRCSTGCSAGWRMRNSS